MNKLLLSFIALSAVTSLSRAAAPSEQLQKYTGSASYAMMICSLELKTALTINETKRLGAERYDLPEQMPPDWHGCITNQKIEIKSSYEAALKTVKKVSAKAALKEHYIIVLTNLDELEPKIDERKIDYTRRQSANNQRLNEKWNRFEIEQ